METRKPTGIISKILIKIDRLSSIAGKMSGILSFLLMFLISGDVFLRYFLNSPIPGTNEIARLTLAWVCFLGVFYAYTNDAHVRVTLVINRFPQKQPFFEIVSCIFALLIFSFLTYKSTLYFWESWVNRELYPAPIPVPHWLAKLSMPVGSFFMFIAVLFNMLYQLRNLFRKNGA